MEESKVRAWRESMVIGRQEEVNGEATTGRVEGSGTGVQGRGFFL